MPPDTEPHARTLRLNGADFRFDIAGEGHSETIVALHGGAALATIAAIFAPFNR